MASTEQLLCALRRTPVRRGGGGVPSAIIDRVQEWKGMGESMLKSLMDSFSDIESREENLRLVSESLEVQLRDFQEKERDSKLLWEGKREALKSREEELKSREEELKSREEELKLKEEKLDQLLKSVDDHIQRLEASQGEHEGLLLKEREKLKEIEKKERELDVNRGLLEKRDKEFNSFHDGKVRELTLKEEALCKEKREFAEQIRLTNEKVKEKQKMGGELIQRLESALNMLGTMKVTLDGKFKDIESKETMAHEFLTAKLNEADLIRESLDKRFRDLENIEKELSFSQEDKTKKLESEERQVGTLRIDKVKLRGEKMSEQEKSGLQMLENEPEGTKQELELKQVNLVSCAKDHDYEEHDYWAKGLSSVRQSAQICVKENLASTKQDQPQKQSVGTEALVADEDQLMCRPRVVESKVMLQGSNQPMSTATTALQKDQKTLEMLINGPDKESELIGDEIYKIISLSSEPAKLVLDTVEGLYAFRSGILDTECKERRATIFMLDQLTNLSPKIQPFITEAAIRLALEWKSRMSSAASMVALAFLHLVAAYRLSCHFPKNELFSFLIVAAKHKHKPDLCLSLGLAEKIPGYIKRLISEKQYLLASTYIYEYQLQHTFSQANILNRYVNYSKWSAKAKCNREHNTLAAQQRAIASEIAALQVAMKHIIKYGLESDYSPNALTTRIEQLKGNQARLRRKIIPPSADIQKPINGNTSRNAGRKARRVLHQNSQMPPHHPTWRAQNQVSQTETCRAPAYSLIPVNSFPFPDHPDTPYKRRKTNIWMNEGGLHTGQFTSSY